MTTAAVTISEAKRLRVLFITRKWPPAVGGMERYCHELSKRLRMSTDLTVRALPGRAGGLPPSPPALLLFGFSTSIYLCYASRRFDVIHIADMALWPLAAIAKLFARQASVAASAHGTDVAYPLRPGIAPKLYEIYLRIGALAARGLRVIANSAATASICRKYGFRNTSIVPLGVETPARPDQAARPERYVLYVGRLVRRKGCAWFIRNVLPRLDEDIRLVVAAVEWDQDESEALQTGRVDFLGPVHGARLQELRRRAIAVVVPNISCDGRDFEGFGLTALEGAAAGGVLLASRLDGITDAVVDGSTGLLLPAEDPQAWADKIHEIAEWPPARRQQFISGALSRIQRDFSWERVAAMTLEAYSQAEARA